MSRRRRERAVTLSDDVGVIDSVRVRQVGATVLVPVAVGRVVARAGTQRLAASAPDSTRTRAIVVIGGAGWEGKFIVSALEERGWPVIARFAVAPNVDVTQGTLALDTSRVAAVIAVDTSIQSLGAAIDRFVQFRRRTRAGGTIAPRRRRWSRCRRERRPLACARPSSRPTRSDSARRDSIPCRIVRRDAIVLDRRPAGVAMAARRIGAGRVLQVGYDDSWRWRMAGAAGSEHAHRDWWSRIVGSVAYAPEARTAVAVWRERAAGAARRPTRTGAKRDRRRARRRAAIDPRLLMALMMICLLTEWGSRRLRGLK